VSSAIATKRVMKSPSIQRFAMPNGVFIMSVYLRLNLIKRLVEILCGEPLTTKGLKR
jgi:hypothetical protein